MAAGLLTLLTTGCSVLPGGSSGNRPAAAPGNAVNGGTLNLGVWREPPTFLAAGVTGDLDFAYVEAAPVQEGLLWYRPAVETQTARSVADYYTPWLATEVPTLSNGDVRTDGCAPVPRNPLLTYAGATATVTGAVVAPAMCVTWKLRDNVLWHDGSAFGSHDVCDTYRLFHLRYGDRSVGANPTPVLSDGWSQTIDCTEKDRLTAVVSFGSIFGPYLSLSSGVYGVLPASILDKAFAAGESTPDHSAANLELYKATLDLTVGSKNPDAFKGSQTLDLMMDGTGPYVFQSDDIGRAVTLVRNRNYWNHAHRPHLDSLVFKVEPDVSAEVSAAREGSIDVGLDYGVQNLRSLQDAARGGALSLQTVPAPGAEKIDMNLCANSPALCGASARHSPFTADRNVRRAILLAIDREEIIDSQLGGRSTIPRDAWQYLGIGYIRDPTTNPRTPYDPDQARRLLESGGYRLSPACDGGHTRANPAGMCLDIDLGTTLKDHTRAAIESLVKGYLQQVGIHVRTPFQPNLAPDKFYASLADGGPLFGHQFDLAMYSATAATPGEPDGYYASYHADCGGTCPEHSQVPGAANQGQGQNSTAENNSALDRELDQARQTADLGAQATIYRRVEALLAADLPDIPLYQRITVNTYTPRLQRVRANEMIWDYNSFDWFCTNGSCQ